MIISIVFCAKWLILIYLCTEVKKKSKKEEK